MIFSGFSNKILGLLLLLTQLTPGHDLPADHHRAPQ